MKLYRNDDMTAGEQWAGTQDEANRRFGRNRWQLVDVPTDKPGLLAFLNQMESDPYTLLSGPSALEPKKALVAPSSQSSNAEAPDMKMPMTPDPQHLIDWIMDSATPAQVESVFTALGVRFHELRRTLNQERGHISLSAQQP